MLDIFRSRKSSMFTWIIFGGIIVFFVINFGPGSFTSGGCGEKLNYAAQVGEVGITDTDFQFSYHNMIQFYKTRFGDRFNAELLEKLQIRDQVINQLIDEEILAQEAANYGFNISEKDLQDAIVVQPAFQSNGKFDYKLYERLVRYYYQTSPAKFEEYQTKSLLANKMKNLLTTNILISKEEVKTVYDLQNDSVTVAFVKISPDTYLKTIKKADNKKLAEVKEKQADEIKKFYEDNKEKYEQPEKIRARHILFKFKSENPDAKEKKAIKARAMKAKERLDKGEDFPKVAAELSEDPGSKAKGGDLGYFARGAMAQKFEEVAFSMKVGEISAPVETKFGYHIIKVEEKKEASKKEFDAVKDEIALILAKKETAIEMAKTEAGKIMEEIKAGKKLLELFPEPKEEEGEDVAKAIKPKKEDALIAKESMAITRTVINDNMVPGIGVSKTLAKDIFTLGKEKTFLPAPVEVDGNYFVIQMTERTAPDNKDFEVQYPELKDRYEMMKANQVLNEWLTQRRTSSNVWVNPQILRYDQPNEMGEQRKPSQRRSPF